MSSLSLMFGLLFIATPLFVTIGLILFLYITRRRIEDVPPVPGNWRAVRGRIVAASVEEAGRSHAEDDVLYYPSIQFEYTDGGQVYTCTQAVGREHNVISRAWQTLQLYPVGKEVIVYCNPLNPREARLWAA